MYNCRFCKSSTNSQNEKMENKGKSYYHPSCVKCHHCGLQESNGEIPYFDGYLWKHPSCPKCNTCGKLGSKDDPVICAWFEADDKFHEGCFVCAVCQSIGPHPDDALDKVVRWSSKEAEGYPYAHTKCLNTIFCESHKQFMPCKC